MNASGMSPWRIFRPFLTTTLVVSVLVAVLERLSGAEGPARIAQLGGQHQDRPRHQHHPARPLHHDRARPDVPHPRAAHRRTADRHLHRRPARSQGARHLAGGARRDRRDRARHVPGADRTAACTGWKSGKPDPTIVKFERYAFDLSRFSGGDDGAELRRARALSVGPGSPGSERPGLQAVRRRNSAPSSTTGWWRRSIRSPSR